MVLQVCVVPPFPGLGIVAELYRWTPRGCYRISVFCASVFCALYLGQNAIFRQKSRLWYSGRNPGSAPPGGVRPPCRPADPRRPCYFWDFFDPKWSKIDFSGVKKWPENGPKMAQKSTGVPKKIPKNPKKSKKWPKTAPQGPA